MGKCSFGSDCKFSQDWYEKTVCVSVSRLTGIKEQYPHWHNAQAIFFIQTLKVVILYELLNISVVKQTKIWIIQMSLNTLLQIQNCVFLFASVVS